MLIQSSARAIPLAAETVQCVVTSPPYWGLRQYAGEQREVWGGEPGHAHEWQARQARGLAWATPLEQQKKRAVTTYGGGSSAFCPCGAWYGALGLEPTPDLYVQHIVEVFREVRRVLRKDGTLWLNLGDSYAGGGGYSPDAPSNRAGAKQSTMRGASGARGLPVARGLKPKDLVGIPWMVAFALRADGWYLRSDIIWHKPNPMPESVTDRPTKSHEYLFLLTKSERYYYDADAIREAAKDSEETFYAKLIKQPHKGQRGKDGVNDRHNTAGLQDATYNPAGRNKRTVWTIATHPYAEAHFATYPDALVEPCIMAGSAAKACGVCGAPWERVTEREGESARARADATVYTGQAYSAAQSAPRGPKRNFGDATNTTLGFQPTCGHGDGSAASRVLDPFNGSGTTGAVAARLGREYVGTDLSADYLAMAGRRIGAVTPIAQTVEHAARVAGHQGAQLTMVVFDTATGPMAIR